MYNGVFLMWDSYGDNGIFDLRLSYPTLSPWYCMYSALLYKGKNKLPMETAACLVTSIVLRPNFDLSYDLAPVILTGQSVRLWVRPDCGKAAFQNPSRALPR